MDTTIMEWETVTTKVKSKQIKQDRLLKIVSKGRINALHEILQEGDDKKYFTALKFAVEKNNMKVLFSIFA